MAAHHGEARDLALGAVRADDRDEAPARLVRLARAGPEARPVREPAHVEAHIGVGMSPETSASVGQSSNEAI